MRRVVQKGPQELLREYAFLNLKRKGEGLTPLEYQRWSDLSGQLARAFPGRPLPGRGGRVKVRVEFRSPRELVASMMWNLKPLGLFVNTPFAADEGCELDLVVALKEPPEEYCAPVIVVSNNVGRDFSTDDLGMGLRFLRLPAPLKELLERLHRA